MLSQMHRHFGRYWLARSRASTGRSAHVGNRVEIKTQGGRTAAWGIISFLQAAALATMMSVTGVEAKSLERPAKPSASQITSKTRIVIRTGERRLYFYDSKNRVRTFKIAVGRIGLSWSGETRVTRKVLRPSWTPPGVVRRDKPHLPKIVPPGPNNPLGAAVLVLGNGTYGIHGTNRSSSIGTAASYGCFRMHNSDILALFKEVKVGTRVTVLP